ncbi:MAG: hypothetical protein GTO55_09880 [Armatimonadetes bacterium]|nr:hypothetical protein [Armatimonadota bacterium]NIM24552.1 hypothetical protein [Armatimonadota bacterium]NIM68426.1 hypothetical protein [Armatimonadota bacterium]NIM76812.1 hypothetical protein [Armatimonadota bacterium]NIN06625.1 hypothetical protein [Armatimonadota bacterium]
MIKAWVCFWRQALGVWGRIWLAIAISALLSAIEVSDCRAAERETVKTPPLTRTASGPVLIGAVRGKQIILTGVWEPKTGWRSAANADEDKDLMPNGTVWTLYGAHKRPVRVTSGPPRVKPRYEPFLMRNRPSDFYVSAELASRPSYKHEIAVAGAGSTDERLVREFPPMWYKPAKRLSDYLLENSPLDALNEMQVVLEDLDGDGRKEHLVTFAGTVWFYPALRDKVDYVRNVVIAAAHTTDNGTYRVSMLTEMAQSMLRGPLLHGKGVRYAEILAITDINGDGRREVAISTDGADWWAFEVYAFDGSRFQQVLFFGGYWAEIRGGDRGGVGLGLELW